MTRNVRKRGFYAFVAMLVGFIFSFPLSIYFKILKQEASITDPTVVRRNARYTLCAGILVCLLIYSEWTGILVIARRQVYEPLMDLFSKL